MNLANPAALDGTLLWGAGLLCLVLIAVTLLRRWQFRQVTLRSIGRDARAEARVQTDLQHSLIELATQVEAMARRLDAYTDARCAQAARQPDGCGSRAGEWSFASNGGDQRAESCAGAQQQVFELSDAGLAAIEIANRLHLLVGEVELSLALRAFAQQTAQSKRG